MSGNVDVGGVSAELALGFQDWTKGLNEALSSLSNFASGVSRLLDRFEKTVEGGAQQAGQSLSTFSDTAARELQEVTRAVQSVGSSMQKEFRAAASASQQGQTAIATALNGVSRVLQQMDQRMDQMARQMDASFEQLAGDMARSGGRIEAALEDVGRQVADVAGDVARHGERMEDALQEVAHTSERAFRQVADNAHEASAAVKEGADRLKTIGMWTAGVGAAMFAGLSGVVVGALKAADEIEGFRVQLETLTGSADRAAAKLDFFRNFAIGSSFELREINEAGVQLENYGRTAERWLPRVANLAAAKNRDVQLMAEAVGKASVGNPEGWEQLRNIGVNGQMLKKFGATLTREGNVDPNAAGNLDALARYLDTLEGADLQRAETIGGRWSMVFDALGKTLSKIGDELAPVAKKVADALTSVISAIGDLPPDVLKWAGALGAVAAALLTVGGALLMLAPHLVAAGTAMSAIGAAASSVAPFLVPLAAGLAIVAAGAVALGVAWAQNWNGIREKTAAAVEGVRNFVAGLWPKVVRGFEDMKVTVHQVWADTWEGAQRLWREFQAYIEPAVTAVKDLFARLWPEIKAIVDMALAFLLPQVEGWARSLVILFETLADALRPLWEGAWNNIVRVVKVAWPLVSGVVEAGLRWIRGLIETAMRLLDGDWRGAWDSITTAFGDSWGIMLRGLGTALDNMLSAIREAVAEFFTAGWSIGAAIWKGIQGALSNASATQEEIAANVRRELAGDHMTDRAVAAAGGAYAQAASWVDRTSAQGAEARRAQEQQALWEERRARGERERASAQPDTGGTAASSDDGGSKKTAKPRQLSAAELVVREASSRVGKPFEAGVAERCAKFIYDVYDRAGIKLKAAQRPLDGGPGGNKMLANSFFSPEVGEIITDPSKLKQGDIVAYPNTYYQYENPKPGDITHAAIYVGDGMVVHRGTGRNEGRPTRVPLTAPGKFAYAVRPYQLAGKAGASQDDLARHREGVEAFESKFESPFAARRASLEKEYRRAVQDAYKAGETDRLDSLKKTYERALADIAGDEQAHNAKMARDFEMKRAEAYGWDVGIHRLAAQQKLAEDIEALENRAREEPAFAQQAQEQIALLRQKFARENAEYEEKTQVEMADRLLKFTEGREQHRREKDLKQSDTDVQLGRITPDEQVEIYQRELDAFRGTTEQKDQLALAYMERWRARLTEQLQLEGEYNTARLEALLAQYEAEGSLEESHVARVAALRMMLRDQQMADLQAAQQVFSQVEQTFQQFLVQTLSAQTSFNQAFGNLWKSIVNTIITELTKAILKLIGFQVILRGILSLFGGGLNIAGSFGSLFKSGAGAAADLTKGAAENAAGAFGSTVRSGAGPAIFHDGGVVGSWPGLAYDEVAAVLQAGEVVVPRAGVRRARQSMADAERGDRGPRTGAFAPTVNITVTGDVDPRAIADQVSAALARQQRAYLQGAY